MTFLGFLIILVASLFAMKMVFITVPAIVYFIVVILELIIYIVLMYNRIVMLKNRVEQSHKSIDIYLKQRFDLIPNLVETVKEYQKYENTILKDIVNLRNDYINREKGSVAIESSLNTSLNNMISIIESYPELKANEVFIKLQNQLIKMENNLQAARRIYNIDVTEYNTYIATFPCNIIASLFKFNQAELFEAGLNEKENVVVEYN